MPNTRTTRTLLDWARDVSRTSAIMRVEPPETSTKELHEMIEVADAARHTTPELDDRCTFCWHDKGHHVHWREDDIGSCVLIMASSGRQHHKCPCEEYVAPAAYRDATREPAPAVEAER